MLNNDEPMKATELYLIPTDTLLSIKLIRAEEKGRNILFDNGDGQIQRGRISEEDYQKYFVNMTEETMFSIRDNPYLREKN